MLNTKTRMQGLKVIENSSLVVKDIDKKELIARINQGHEEIDYEGDVSCNFEAHRCIKLKDYMGNDQAITNAARVSFKVEIAEDEPLKEGDMKLLKYMADHNHSSPFYHPQISFKMQMPIFLARQWFRHNVGITRNEVSRRYVTKPVQCFLPVSAREQHPQKKQGSKDDAVKDNDECLALMKKSMNDCVQTYRDLLSKGVCAEEARMVLPQSMMTEFVETGSLAAYANIYRQRIACNAQTEIRDYAVRIGEILSVLYPVSWKHLTAQ